jgi:glycosyltransferase involved in cell wall biosynthesis
MNILFICDEYPPGKHGGAGTMVRVLGRELVRQGHAVTVMGLYSYYYGQKDYEIDEGVEVYRYRYGLNFGNKRRNFFYKVVENLPDWIKSKLNGRKAFKHFVQKIHQLIAEKQIEVIEIQDYNSFALEIGFDVKWPIFKAPLTVKSCGSHTYLCHGTNQEAVEKFVEIDRNLYARADALSAVSHFTESVNQELFHYNQVVTILHNGIESTFNFELNQDREEATFIFTGTLSKTKGIYSLLRAWNKVNVTHPEAALYVYGKGDIEVLKKELNTNSINRVHFMGYVSREQLYQELSKATAAIFPSYLECFAMAPLEALAVGCPVINTSRASGKELIEDGVNGSLIDPDNLDEMAEKIIELIENEELQRTYSHNGRETILKHFTIEKSAKEHIDFYKKVIQDFNA